MRPDIILIAGEASGDVLGGTVMRELLNQRPLLNMAGLGGPQMKAASLSSLWRSDSLRVMGITAVLRRLPQLWKLFREMVDTIMQTQPKAVVTIDFPDFNLRLGKALRNRGYRGTLCHVVCPSIWAWRPGRAQGLSATYNLLLTLLPFEKELFSSSGLHVEYIGHPAVNTTQFLPLQTNPTIALFPGSRKGDIERMISLLLRTVPQWMKDYPHLKFAISATHHEEVPWIRSRIAGSPITSVFVGAHLVDCAPMLAIAKCGTVTLELALQGIPTVVIHPMSRVDAWLARYLFRINLPAYSLPNIMMKSSVFPELIGPALSVNSLASTVSELIDQPQERHHIHEQCRHLRDSLNQDSSSLERGVQALLCRL